MTAIHTHKFFYMDGGSMALNYDDLETLRPKLIPRCVAIAQGLLLYLQNGGEISSGVTPAANQTAWCTDNIKNVPSWGEELSRCCMSEATFISSGTSITDGELKSRVEYVIKTYKLPAAEVLP